MTQKRLIVRLRPEGEANDAFVKDWDERLKQMAAEPGCRQFELFRSVRNPNTFVLLEHWDSQEALEAHWAAIRAAAPAPEGQGPVVVREVLEYYDHRGYDFDGTTLTPLD
jgi:quinol monooxygenase YgiN